MSFLFTSECVSAGHPDKIADVIADSFVDHFLQKDPNSRVAIECLLAGHNVVVGGEVTSEGFDPNAADELTRAIVSQALRTIGYAPNYKFAPADAINAATAKVQCFISGQSPDIALGVSRSKICAGDQGMVFATALKETRNLMPAPIEYSRRLKDLFFALAQDPSSPFGLDIKTQVTLEYASQLEFRLGQPKRVHTVVVSIPNLPSFSHQQVVDAVRSLIARQADELFDGLLDDDTVFHINPTGRYVRHSSVGDAGVVGRKIVVDAFGGRIANGGGAFSGKDPSKVDRSGVYLARHIAKSVVASDLADVCDIQLAYAIGVAEPVAVLVNTQQSGKLSDLALATLIRNTFDLSVQGTIDSLRLQQPGPANFCYRDLAMVSHFLPQCPWEQPRQLCA